MKHASPLPPRNKNVLEGFWYKLLVPVYPHLSTYDGRAWNRVVVGPGHETKTGALEPHWCELQCRVPH